MKKAGISKKRIKIRKRETKQEDHARKNFFGGAEEEEATPPLEKDAMGGGGAKNTHLILMKTWTGRGALYRRGL